MQKSFFRTSVRVSYEILELVSKDARFKKIARRKESPLIVDVFTNCREGGFMVKYYGEIWAWGREEEKYISFCENRSSDDIVVSFGNSKDFDNRHNTAGDYAYHNAKYFSGTEQQKAADFILDYLFN